MALPPHSDDARSDPAAAHFYPDNSVLTAALGTLLSNSGTPAGSVAILDRQVNDYISTLPSEIVTCRVAGGGTHRLFCKYTGDAAALPIRSRHGLAYEIQVYERILSRLHMPLPRFYGSFHDPQTRQTCLVTECVEGYQASLAEETEAMPAGAAWCGLFHAQAEEMISSSSISFSESDRDLLLIHDAGYYRSWSLELQKVALPVQRRYPWVASLCRRYEQMIPLLTDHRQIIIHGEFTPHNLLWQDGRIIPIDWESTAIGMGEVDLATLFQGWDENTMASCISSYIQARWQGAPPSSFRDTLTAARLYVAMHWLSVASKWAVDDGPVDFLEELLSVARELAIL